MYDFTIDVDLQDLEKEVESKKSEINRLKAQINDLRSKFNDQITLKEFAKGHRIKKNIPSQHSIQLNRRLRGHYEKINAVSWNPLTTTNLVSASQDGALIFWDGLKGFKTKFLRLDSQWVMTASYSLDGKFIAVGGLDNCCTLHHTIDYPSNDHSKETAVKLRYHSGFISSCEFLSDNDLVTSSGDQTCVLWDVETQRASVVFAEHISDVMSVSARDENSFYSAGCDQTAKLWDIRTKKCVQSHSDHHENDINIIRACPGGSAFATGSDDSTVRLCDIRCWNQVNIYQIPREPSGVTSLDFSFSGKIFFAGYDNHNVQCWDTINAIPIEPRLEGHHGRVSCLKVSPDGMAIATGGWDTILNIWA